MSWFGLGQDPVDYPMKAALLGVVAAALDASGFQRWNGDAASLIDTLAARGIDLDLAYDWARSPGLRSTTGEVSSDEVRSGRARILSCQGAGSRRHRWKRVEITDASGSYRRLKCRDCGHYYEEVLRFGADFCAWCGGPALLKHHPDGGPKHRPIP